MILQVEIPDSAVAFVKEFYIDKHGYDNVVPFDEFLSGLLVGELKGIVKNYIIGKEANAAVDLLKVEKSNEIDAAFVKGE